MIRDLLDNSYPNEISCGKIRWLTDDFQENGSLAKQFDVVSSCVVVAVYKDGLVTDYKRLDEVWSLMKETEAFN